MQSSSEGGLVRRRQQGHQGGVKASFVISSETSPSSSMFSSSAMSTSMTPMASSTRDRTSEFLSAVRAFQGRHMLEQSSATTPTPSLTRGSTEFASIAKHISLDIASTATKLEKLSLLARRQTLFDDRPMEIAELTEVIKQDMNALNRQIGQLQQIGRANVLRVRGQHQQSHATSVVLSLQTQLASMSADFKSVLETRKANLRERKSRENKFSQGAVTTSLPQSAVKGYHMGSVLAAMDDESNKNDDVAISMESSSQLMLNNEHEQYLESRAGTMQNIERTVVELGSIFSQLAHMIKEQEEIMVRIDSNVEDAALNVEAGHSELLKYFQSVSSNRWLMIKVFGILIFFFILFVVFMA